MREKLFNPLTIVAAVLALAVIGVVLAGQGKPASKPQQQTKRQLLGVQHPNLGQKHLKTLDETHDPYNSNPPSSGPHYYLPAEWGVHTGVVLDEVMVHNEEHGGIIITYKPDLSKQDIAKLEAIVQSLQAPGHGRGYKVLMFARAADTHPIQLVSWLYTYDLDTVDGQKIEQFYVDHLNKAPEPEAM